MARTASRSQQSRRGRLQRRAIPLIALALLAFVVGLIIGAPGRSGPLQLADRWAAAWTRGDYAGMHKMLTPDARERYDADRFRAVYERAATTATSLRGGVRAQVGREDDETVVLPTTVRTRVWGTVAGNVVLPVDEDLGDEALVDWKPYLAFPGLREGQRLTRRTQMGERGSILSRNGRTIAEGQARTPSSPSLATLAGTLGQQPAELRRVLRPLGYPATALVGISGLELALQTELAGTPGGELRAGRQVIARARPRDGEDIRSTIDLDLQETATAALGDRLGGVAVIRPRDGEVLALGGQASTGLQPPGSTFKIITLTAGLESGKTRLGKRYPVETQATLDGAPLENANGEMCGGTLTETFAESCNSVFAPLGAAVGARKLVGTAERYGFNRPPGFLGAAISRIPPPQEIVGDLALGATAIGQGKVEATALEMAVVAATIADRGRRPRPVLQVGEDTDFVRVTTPDIARDVRQMMIQVVRSGTGTAAGLPNTTVAGKTGTAEIGPSTGDDTGDPTDTTAWFAAFAPANDPEVAVAVWLAESGAGGETAAPAARQVIDAAT